ncbi:MAG: hypothetical protein AB7G21_08950 [Dehalococcoidia bacterium]
MARAATKRRTEPCPFCGGMVPLDALKCAHCGEWLEAVEVSPARRAPAPPQAPAPSGSSKALNTFLAVVLGAVVLVFYFRARAGESYAVQVTGHNAVAVFRGPFARSAGTGALAGFGQAAQEVDADSGGGGGTVCRLRHDAVSVEVRDSGVLGTSVGGALCAHLRARGWAPA